jgi:hypothetical protein
VRPWSAIVAVALVSSLSACAPGGSEAPPCAGRTGNQWLVVVAAQAVPSATFLPCIRPLPTGWTITQSSFESGSYTAWLDSDRAGIHAVEIRLTPTCDVSDAVEVPAPDAPTGVRIFERPISLAPAFSADRFAAFAGGCVTYAFRFAPEAPATLALEVQQAFDVLPRATARRFVEGFGLELCGAGAPPCPG